MKNKLVSIALFTYNQEKYIFDAVQSLLMQTYTPLEIILSDDASSDSTYLIMEKIVNEYKGIHNLSLVRNEKNLGIGGHVNNIFSIFKGEWLIMSAGDDISLPDRVEKIIDYASKNINIDCISVALLEIDGVGNRTGRIYSRFKPEDKIGCLDIRGAGLAYSRSLISSFNNIPNDIHNEDIVMTARALLKSKIGIINEPLVLYRSHELNRMKRNWLFSHFTKNWYDKNSLEAKRVLAYTRQINYDVIGFDKNKIPDFQRLILENKIALVKLKLINRKYINIKDICLICSKLKLLKFAIGLIIFRLKYEI